MNKRRLYGINKMRKAITYVWGVLMIGLLVCCNSAVVDPKPAPVIEIVSGYTIQLTATSDGQWGSDNPSVATVSSTGLVTAVGAGNATIYTYSSKGEQHIVCYLEVNPKRNILFYIATDVDDIDKEAPEKINEIKAGWKPDQGEMLIYVDRRVQGAMLLRMNNTPKNGYFDVDTLEIYGVENSANSAVLARTINILLNDYPADSYGMIFFSHGSGWLPSGTFNSPHSLEADPQIAPLNPNEVSLRSLVIDNGEGIRHEMEYYDFAAAIPDNKFDFIILEACLMSDVLSMYELRNKAEYVLVSSAEIVSPGFTHIYQNEIMGLYDTKNSVFSVVSGFAQAFHDIIITQFQENSVYCSSTLGIIKMSEMQNLATTVKAALGGIAIDESTLTIDNIQTFDRPNAQISSFPRRYRYFDLDHVMENLASASQYTAFNDQMEKTVVWKANTKRFLSGQSGFLINRHCGLTTYIQQSVYPFLNDVYENSSWFKAIY